MLTQEQKERTLRWAEALEFGEYKQTTGRLRQGNRYCCLGVACDLSYLNKWTIDNFYGGKLGSLPINVMEFYGLPSPFGFIDPETSCTLDRLNDFNQYTFPQIAQVIRKWVETQ